MTEIAEPRAESEALEHSFSYLVNSIDTAALLPAAMSGNLITDRQRTECFNESDPYKKTETFLGYLQRAVNGDYHKFDTFLDILQKSSQQHIVTRLRDELAHSSKLLEVSSTDEGEQKVVHVPDGLIQELADLRFGFAKLTFKYKREIQTCRIAEQDFVEFLPQLCIGLKIEGSGFQSHFKKLIEEEISLFNVYYLKRLCEIFPKDICTTTTQLVDTYEQQLQKFKTGASLAQFKQLFPASATHSKLSTGKVPVKLKLENEWNKRTIADLEKLVKIFGILGSHLHLTKVEFGCIEVTWLCTLSVAEDIKLKITTSEISYLLQTMGVVNVHVHGQRIECQSAMSADQPPKLQYDSRQILHRETERTREVKPHVVPGAPKVKVDGGKYETKYKEKIPFTEKVRVEDWYVADKHSSNYRKDYAGRAKVGSVSGGAVGGIVGSIVPGPGTLVGLAVGAAIGGGIGAAAGGVGGAGAGAGIGVGAVHHAKTKKGEKNKK